MTDQAVAQPRERGRVMTALTTIGGFVALLWVIEIIDSITGGRLEQFGVQPRQIDGLLGVLTMPLLHDDWGHLIANTVPLLVLGFLILLSGVKQWAQATAVIWVVAGLGTWLLGGANSVHIGASGIVFGWIVYLVLRGFFARKPLQIVIGLLVLGAYGGVLLGVFPGNQGVSWQGHLSGAIGGGIAAALIGERNPKRSERT